MLGMNDASRFNEVEFQLGEGEFLLLISDGIIDSPCGDRTQFGISGIVGFFAGYSGSTPLEALLKEVRRRGAASSAVDDISAVLLAPALAPGLGFPL
jgi:serine phosphatase RsbU (regulator of sigma subunit)